MMDVNGTMVIPENITALTTRSYEGNKRNPKHEIIVDGQTIKFEDRDERDRSFQNIMMALSKLHKED